MKFMDYLKENKEGKNVHLEHLEDNVLNAGVSGAREAIEFLRSLRNMLAGHTGSKVNVTTKWDGAPAIFAGTNPENGKFLKTLMKIIQVLDSMKNLNLRLRSYLS